MELSRVSFIRALTTFTRDPPSWSNHLRKAPTSHTITLRVKISKYEFWGDRKNQSVKADYLQTQMEDNAKSSSIITWLSLTNLSSNYRQRRLTQAIRYTKCIRIGLKSHDTENQNKFRTQLPGLVALNLLKTEFSWVNIWRSNWVYSLIHESCSIPATK